MFKPKDVEMWAMWLALIGALNWGLAELGFNLVELLLGAWPMVVSTVYYLVGASGLYLILKKLKVM